MGARFVHFTVVFLPLLVYQAMREVVDSEKVMRSLSTNFIGPIEADTEFSITIEVLREGKNVTSSCRPSSARQQSCIDEPSKLWYR